jgi:hypothetical protein
MQAWYDRYFTALVVISTVAVVGLYVTLALMWCFTVCRGEAPMQVGETNGVSAPVPRETFEALESRPPATDQDLNDWLALRLAFARCDVAECGFQRWLKIKNRAHPSISRVREAFAHGNKLRA